MNSKRLAKCAYPTTEACPKFWGVISYQQRLQKRLDIREPIVEVFSNDPRLRNLAEFEAPA